MHYHVLDLELLFCEIVTEIGIMKMLQDQIMVMSTQL